MSTRLELPHAEKPAPIAPSGPGWWSPQTRRRLIVIALLALPVVMLAIGGWAYHHMNDDGFINLRVVSQIKAGNGPVFNAGERVEAATSPLWIATLLLVDFVTPFRLEWIAVVTGIVLTVGGLILAIAGSVRLQRGLTNRSVWLPAGALVVAAFPRAWRFASSGLENGLTYAWLGSCLLVLATWSRDDRRLSPWAAVVLGLGPLVRPEFTVLSLLFLAVVIAQQWRTDNWRRRIALLGAAGALPVAYEIFRMGYYASLVPNTAIAKEGAGNYWSSGLNYLHETVLDNHALWLPLVALVVGLYVPLLLWLRSRGRQRAVAVLVVFAVGAVVHTLLVVRVGGDFMPARLLLPAVFLLVGPVAVVPMTTRFVATALIAVWAVVSVAALRTTDDNSPPLGNKSSEIVTTDDFGFGPHGRNRRPIEAHGLYFFTVPIPGTPSRSGRTIAAYGVGVVSYALGPKTYVLDLLGLGDPFTAHLKLHKRGIVGHEKPLPTPWIAARVLRPDPPVPENQVQPHNGFVGPRIDHPGKEPFVQRVADARRALRCPRLKEFFATYRARLDTGRFFDNLGAAFTNFGFRIPPEPRDTLKKLCRTRE